MKQTTHSETKKRSYHSRVRQHQAEETRQRLPTVARELFTSRGYTNTILEMISEAAEVSPKTTSAIFGSKRGILVEVVNPQVFNAHVKLLLDELYMSPNPMQQVALVAQITCQVYESLVKEMELLRTAGSLVPELVELAQQVEARRHQNQHGLVASLQERGMLRHGLSREKATDVLWTLTSYDLYRLLVIERHWSLHHYESWLASLLIEQVLQPDVVSQADFS